MTNEIKYNLHALSDVFLSNDEIKDVTILFVTLEDKNKNIISEQSIPKETLLDSLIKIFDQDLHDVKEINVYFESENKKKLLNGISIS